MADRVRRGSFGPTVAAGLTGAALATVAAGQTWATATTRTPAFREVAADGSDVAPALLPLALVALAAWGTVLVLRRRGRQVVAVLGAVAAMTAGAVALLRAPDSADVAAELLGGLADVTTDGTAWPYVAAAGCAVSAVASAVAVVRAGGWPELSRRYDAPDAPDAPGAASEADLWKALDEGRDPTV